MKNFRDIEQLSAYLDGQLNPSDSARLESRINTDPELASALSDLRSARSILRKLPKRKAPRNFTLTRQMVGLKPPLPRTFSFFRFSTAFATFLLMLTFAANLLIPRISFGAGAPMMAQEAYGMGGGGCDPCLPEAAATEAPLAIEAAPAATEAPVATEAPALAPSADTNIAPTATAPIATEDTARMAETPIAKTAENTPAPQGQPPAVKETLIPLSWQAVLLAIVLISAATAFIIRQNAKKKWS